jgi:hypothetical protein
MVGRPTLSPLFYFVCIYVSMYLCIYVSMCVLCIESGGHSSTASAAADCSAQFTGSGGSLPCPHCVRVLETVERAGGTWLKC